VAKKKAAKPKGKKAKAKAKKGAKGAY